MMMNRTALLLILLLAFTAPLLADDAVKPDYSQDALFRFAHEFVLHPQSKVGDFEGGRSGCSAASNHRRSSRVLPCCSPGVEPAERAAWTATYPGYLPRRQ